VPDKKFLEEYPLYRKFRLKSLPLTLDKVPVVQINMNCATCQSNQTFGMSLQPYNGAGHANSHAAGSVVSYQYTCTHCREQTRNFTVYMYGGEHPYLEKVGQHPPWKIEMNRELEQALGDNSDLYAKGLVCESQGYGIGAFGYYRRIVEWIIEDLLVDVEKIMSGEEREIYSEALTKVKGTHVAAEKIHLVKDLLPEILRPEGMNPLSALHSALSEGLHAKSDEDCLDYAASCKEVLVFLVTQLAITQVASSRFTQSMRNLLDKKS